MTSEGRMKETCFHCFSIMVCPTIPLKRLIIRCWLFHELWSVCSADVMGWKNTISIKCKPHPRVWSTGGFHPWLCVWWEPQFTGPAQQGKKRCLLRHWNRGAPLKPLSYGFQKLSQNDPEAHTTCHHRMPSREHEVLPYLPELFMECLPTQAWCLPPLPPTECLEPAFHWGLHSNFAQHFCWTLSICYSQTTL